MRKFFISVLIGFAIFISSFGFAYAISAGSEMVRNGSRTDRKLQSQPVNLSQAGMPVVGQSALAPDTVCRIGAFLPLSGAYSGIGLRFKHGLELALAAGKTAVFPWQIDYIDSAAISPATALADFKKRGVNIILGPIQSSLAQPVVKAAISLQLPLILLAPQPELTNTDRSIFQHFLNAADEAREIVRLLRRYKETRVALLHPENSFGNLFSKVFTQSCRTQEITIWKNSGYDPAAVDFSSVIKGLRQPQAKLDLDRDRKGDAIPCYPFSALVIADFWPRLRLIVPQLAFFGVEQQHLYATNRGSELNFAKGADSKLDGIIFIDSSFHSPHSSNLVKSYKSLYLKAYNEPASIYDAYAYDTVRLLTEARELMAKGEATDLVDSLLKVPSLELLTGTTIVTADGVFAKQLTPVTYKSGKLLQVQ
ncbi:MAG: hypothetical protein DRH03_01520 [Deltaproteobacteria bacterium]|nr:MAG: hypothetical protein DRH03_01520 [Deltaproteobacteria bacterium]